MEYVKRIMGAFLVTLLVAGGIGFLPAVEAKSAGGTVPNMNYCNAYVNITAGNITVLFPGNQTKPHFVWWDNNYPSKVYVVQFKGLYEYASVDGADFTLTNLAEGALWQRVIQEANARDLSKVGSLSERLSYAFESHSRLMLAAGKAALFKADSSWVKAELQEAARMLGLLREEAEDPEIRQQIDSALGAIGAAIDALDRGANKGEIRSAISNAVRECQRLTQMIAEKSKAAVRSMIESRLGLEALAEEFHPALLPFSGCKWEMSQVVEILAGGGSGEPIGIAFNLTVVDAPAKFDFAEGNVTLAVRIYGSDVVESVAVNDSYSYSYSVAAGEVKIDLVVRGWEWNFDPRTVKLLNSTEITVSPALALWADISSFTVENVTEDLFGDLECVKAQTRLGNITFSDDGPGIKINANGEDQDARGIGLQHKLANKFLAGKSMKFATPAKLKLTEEGTLGGFFRFVPQAVVESSGERVLVDVTASYMRAGNHVKVFLCYPYFNGTLVHDPSLGVEGEVQDSNPAFLVTLASSGTGVASVQAVPTTPGWAGSPQLLFAGGLVLAGALAMIIFVRRHPAAV
ncbi:MAG: hypothetical protein QFX35_04265 [Candidatus Verstraetearchaeota archaeon]|nr:hypothetical protein [Candidatus Verstraetearchaeota archaeon]